MITIVKNVLGAIFGFAANSSLPNKVSGVANYAFFIPFILWIWSHRANELALQILFEYKEHLETITLFQTTFGGFALISGAVFVYLEFLRRANPGNRVNPPLKGITPEP